MRIDFPYPGYEKISPVDVPDANLMGIYAPRDLGEIDEQAVLAGGIAARYGAPRLRDELRGRRRVVLLVDDATRNTPAAQVLPHVAAEIEAAGLADESVTILTAPGTHREMTEEELREKLGRFRDRFAVRQHHWRNEAELHEFGSTRDGVRVTANRLLAESDFTMGIGSIVPHRIKGFSGGAKIVFPGVAGKEMMEKNQWEASLRMSETVMGTAENPMRLRMEEAAQMAGLRYIVNVVVDIRGRIGGCFAGDPVLAHRAGCVLAREVFGARMPGRADIVLIDAHPADRDFWQSAKGFYAGTMAVQRGGTLIVAAPNPEGIARNHENLLEIGYRPHQELIRMVEAGGQDDIVGIAFLGDMAQIIEFADCVMVSPGAPREQVEKLGIRYAASVAEAVESGFERQGRSAQVAVLRHGGHILPLASGS
jgi:nickel-dependent lactate racemase